MNKTNSAASLLDQIGKSSANIRDLIYLNSFSCNVEIECTKKLSDTLNQLNAIERFLVKQSNSSSEHEFDKENSVKKRANVYCEKNSQTFENKMNGRDDENHNDTEDDLAFLRQVSLLESSLNETPLNKSKILTPSKNCSQNSQTDTKVKKSIAFQSNSQSSEDRLLNEFIESKFPHEITKLEEKCETIDETIVECSSDDERLETNQKYVQILKRYFGYSSFRKIQLKIIKNSIEKRRDQLVVMATGSGKSMCYQFPAIYSKGITVVVSPLISLMEDQVMSLKLVNVEACLLGTGQDDNALVQQNLLSGKCRILYLTPEYLEGCVHFLEQLEKKIGIDLMAIDECHCVSNWGNDFRPSYRQIGKLLREKFPSTPFMALTATATPIVRKDIVKSLRLIEPIVTVTSFDRNKIKISSPNLYLSVSQKSSSVLKDLLSLMEDHEDSAAGNVSKKFNGTTIIYALTKNDTEEICQKLRSIGIKCDFYHAGVNLEKRKQSQLKFINDEIDVMVATVAFGMGIDKPDIRNIVHYGSPKNLESYYQEIGRAGRDGLPSKCHIFYSTADFNIIRSFLNSIENPQFRNFQSKIHALVRRFLSTYSCRRKILLDYFENDIEFFESRDANDSNCFSTKPDCCDNCSAKLKFKSADPESKSLIEDECKDFTEEAKKLFSTMKLINYKFGLNTYILFLMGSKSEKIRSKIRETHFSNALYGSGKSKSEQFWKALGQQLMNENFICTKFFQDGFGSYVELTSKANDFLSHYPTNRIKLHETKEMRQSVASKAANHANESGVTISFKLNTFILPLVPVNEIKSTSFAHRESSANKDKIDKEVELYKYLMSIRDDLATEMGLSAQKVCTNTQLSVLAKLRPSSKTNLERVEGFPIEKIERIGARFVEKISLFCSKFNLNTDNFERANTDAKTVVILDQATRSLISCLPNTCQETYIKYQTENKTIDQVCLERGLSKSTVYSHLEAPIILGLPIDYARLGIKNEDIDLVEKKIRQPPINSNIGKLTAIKEQCPEMSWEHLKISLALLKRKYGIGYDNQAADDSNSKQSAISLEELSRNQTESNKKPLVQGACKEKELPTWLKRPSSDDDLKSLANNQNDCKKTAAEKDFGKPKKKPKLF